MEPCPYLAIYVLVFRATDFFGEGDNGLMDWLTVDLGRLISYLLLPAAQSGASTWFPVT
jgi:hypothetical protein